MSFFQVCYAHPSSSHPLPSQFYHFLHFSAHPPFSHPFTSSSHSLLFLVSPHPFHFPLFLTPAILSYLPPLVSHFQINLIFFPTLFLLNLTSSVLCTILLFPIFPISYPFSLTSYSLHSFPTNTSPSHLLLLAPIGHSSCFFLHFPSLDPFSSLSLSPLCPFHSFPHHSLHPQQFHLISQTFLHPSILGNPGPK